MRTQGRASGGGEGRGRYVGIEGHRYRLLPHVLALEHAFVQPRIGPWNVSTVPALPEDRGQLSRHRDGVVAATRPECLV